MRLMITGALLATALVAGCGGGGNANESAATPTATQGSSSGGGGGGQTLQLAAPADGSLKFTKTDLTAKAGKVTIKFDNPSPVPHAVEIEGDGKSQVITKGTTSLDADLKPGKYTFFCPVGQHEAAGMKGTLTVQ